MRRNQKPKQRIAQTLPRQGRVQAVVVGVVEEAKEEAKEEEDNGPKHPRRATRPTQIGKTNMIKKKEKTTVVVVAVAVAVKEVVAETVATELTVSKTRTRGSTSTTTWRGPSTRRSTSRRTPSSLPCLPERKDSKSLQRPTSTEKWRLKTLK